MEHKNAPILMDPQKQHESMIAIKCFNPEIDE